MLVVVVVAAVQKKKEEEEDDEGRRRRAGAVDERGVCDRESEGTREEEALSRSEDGARCVRSPRNALFCPRKRARERERIADKEDERDGRRERIYHVVRGSGGIARSRVAAVVASLSSSATRNAAAGGANIGRKEGRANGLYACNSASRAGREWSECVRERRLEGERARSGAS